MNNEKEKITMTNPQWVMFNFTCANDECHEWESCWQDWQNEILIDMDDISSWEVSAQCDECNNWRYADFEEAESEGHKLTGSTI
jgi:hypothetical protein